MTEDEGSQQPPIDAPEQAPAIPEGAHTFNLSDIIGLPDPPKIGRTATRTFTAKIEQEDSEPLEKHLTIEIRADAKYHAEEFHRLLNYTGRALQECGSLPGAEDEEAEGITVTYPFGDVAIKIDEPGYLANIYTLAAVTIAPPDFANKPEAWIIAGHKLGPTVMEEIFDWVGEVNGMTDYVKKKLAEVKKKSKKKAGSA